MPKKLPIDKDKEERTSKTLSLFVNRILENTDRTRGTKHAEKCSQFIVLSHHLKVHII